MKRGSVIIAAALLLALFAVRLVDTARENTLTVDEPHYIGTGLYMRESGDYHYARVLRFHPPLAYHLASTLLFTLDLDDVPRDLRIAVKLLGNERWPIETVRLTSRAPFILLALWGGFLVFAWAAEAAGAMAGLLALALFTLSPTIVANASLAHSDITVTIFYVQTLYALWRWLERRTPARLLLVGLSLGLALAAKASALLLLPAIGLVLAFDTVRSKHAATPSLSWPRAALASIPGVAGTYALFLLAAVAVIWVSYGGSFAWSKGIGVSGWDAYELPAYIHSLGFDVSANAAGRITYLFGEYSKTGWWYFFPAAYLVKTPLAVVAMLVWAACLRRPALIRITAVLVTTIGVYLYVACFVLQVPLGFRYVLPVIPLIHVLIATRLVPLATGVQRVALAALMAWLTAAGLWIHPHYLAYFNESVGGPGEADRILIESNLDWGQGLKALAEYLRERGTPEVHLAYFGVEKPAYHGLDATKLRGCDPVTGTVAISVNHLRRLYSPDNPFKRPPEGCYDWLLEREPVARPGYSIVVYDIPPEQAPPTH